MDLSLVPPCGQAEFPAQTAAYTGAAGNTTGWSAGPQGVFVWSTTNAFIEVGNGVTATSSSTPIPANVPVLFKVPPGAIDGWRVSAVQIGAAGSVYAKPVNR